MMGVLRMNDEIMMNERHRPTNTGQHQHAQQRPPERPKMISPEAMVWIFSSGDEPKVCVFPSGHTVFDSSYRYVRLYANVDGK